MFKATLRYTALVSKEKKMPKYFKVKSSLTRTSKFQVNKRLCLKKRRTAPEEQHLQLSSGVHIHVHTRTRAHTHTNKITSCHVYLSNSKLSENSTQKKY